MLSPTRTVRPSPSGAVQDVKRDILSIEVLKRLDAALDTSVFGDGTRLPWHWLHFLPDAPTGSLAKDGHPVRNDDLAEEFPRRMWAGSRIQVIGPAPPPGENITRRTLPLSTERKQGSSGRLLFMTVLHEFLGASGVVLREEQDIVYRAASAELTRESGRRPADKRAEWARDVDPSPALLFRFSALTFNTHRIHYDRDYAQREEGYPGLVVHGPLQATLMLDLVHRVFPSARISAFEFRALRPVFDNGVFRVCASPGPGPGRLDLWTQDSSGYLGMQAKLVLAGEKEEF